jgi:Heparinase II/III-like protein/Heparinase II/III N-terminus
LPVIRQALNSYDLIRCFGLSWLKERLRYEFRLRSGRLLRQTPVGKWGEKPLEGLSRNINQACPERYREYRRRSSPAFFFDPNDRIRFSTLFSGWDRGGSNSLLQAEGMKKGIFFYFGRTPVTWPFPPDWHRNPFTGQRAPADRHWSRIDDFGFGDIKVIWEMNRFGFAYTLVRAYWRTGNEEYPELFWQLVEDWRRNNPPNRGANWKCGQEISLRLMAWVFGLYGFLDSPATTARRVWGLAEMAALSGERIAANVGYALSQRNNHGISEGVGLWTAGVLFPEFARAEAWREEGRRILEKLGRELIYEDGSFAQHSVNYHRLMLQDYLWALRLGEIHGQAFSGELKERVGKAADFLVQLQDPSTGLAPCYGANDGALILPLDNCDYRDMRPVTQAVRYLATGKRCHGSGPWDEDLLWLYGPGALDSPAEVRPNADLRAPQGGYYTLRTPTSHIFTRCGAFRHRPSQADLLHVDLWWRGQNVALDPGTYSYNGPTPWSNALAGTLHHNTVSVDGQDQMNRVGRFLWLPWPKAKVRLQAPSNGQFLTWWEGEHDGYRRLKAPVRHRRGIVRLEEEWWLVVDHLSSPGDHEYRLHWLFQDVPYSWDVKAGLLLLKTPAGAYWVKVGGTTEGKEWSLATGEAESARGWNSPYYGCREPALSLSFTVRARSTVFWSLFGPEAGAVACARGRLEIETGRWAASLELGINGSSKTSSPLIVSSKVKRGKPMGKEECICS